MGCGEGGRWVSASERVPYCARGGLDVIHEQTKEIRSLLVWTGLSRPWVCYGGQMEDQGAGFYKQLCKLNMLNPNWSFLPVDREAQAPVHRIPFYAFFFYVC